MDPSGYLCDVCLNTTETHASVGLFDLYPSAEETAQFVFEYLPAASPRYMTSGIFTLFLVPSDEDYY